MLSFSSWLFVRQVARARKSSQVKSKSPAIIRLLPLLILTSSPNQQCHLWLLPMEEINSVTYSGRSKARLLAIISFALVFLYLLRRTLVAEPSSTGHDAYHHPTIRRRTVAIADLHGDLPHALNVLTMAGVITSPSQAHWKPSSDFFHDSQQTSQQRHGISRSDTILVSTGDIVDRGDDTIALYRLFERLRREAANQQISSSSQGQVKNCIGNHELMNALGDWRYVTPGDIQSFGGEMERRKMMSSEGWLGRLWLEHYNVSHSIDLLPPEQVRVARDLPSEYRLPRASFVHGGIHPSWAATGLDHINTVGQSLLSKALTEASLSGTRPS